MRRRAFIPQFLRGENSSLGDCRGTSKLGRGLRPYTRSPVSSRSLHAAKLVLLPPPTRSRSAREREMAPSGRRPSRAGAWPRRRQGAEPRSGYSARAAAARAPPCWRRQPSLQPPLSLGLLHSGCASRSLSPPPLVLLLSAAKVGFLLEVIAFLLASTHRGEQWQRPARFQSSVPPEGG
jgi:hypothetical protein